MKAQIARLEKQMRDNEEEVEKYKQGIREHESNREFLQSEIDTITQIMAN